MRKTHLPLIVLGLVIIAGLLGGCTLRAAPDVTPTPSDQDEMDQGMAQMATQAALTATSTAAAETAVPTAEPTTPPTTAPTAEPTVAETPEPTQPATAAPTATPTAAATTPPSTSGTTGAQTYVVQPGDNLYRIALRYDMSYRDLASYNNIVNPHDIKAGQTIRIPAGGAPSPQPPSGGRTHVVQPGENLFRIALRYNMSYLYLASYNNITNPNQIYVGQTIQIP